MIQIDKRSFILQKKNATVIDFGMPWSHLSAFGHTFLNKQMSEEAEVETGGALMLWFAKPVTYTVYQDEVT